MDADGLPYIGTRMTCGDPFYCYRNDAEGVFVVKKFDGKETCFVDAVKLCGNETGSGSKNRVCITLRVPRNPNVGDKFASRFSIAFASCRDLYAKTWHMGLEMGPKPLRWSKKVLIGQMWWRQGCQCNFEHIMCWGHFSLLLHELKVFSSFQFFLSWLTFKY